MSGSFGIAAIVAAILVCLGAGVYVMRLAKRRKSKQAEPTAASEGRLAIVESTVVDPERRLLLVRCDNVEHLILVGGPADVVVENDVHRNRLGGRSMSRPFGGSASLSRGSHAGHDEGDAHAPEPPAAAGAEVKPLEPKRAHGNPPEAPPVAAAPRLALAPVPAPPSHANGKNGAAAPTVAAPSRVAPAAPSGRGGAEKPWRLESKPAATAKADEPSEARSAKLRLETSDQQFGRRDNAASPPRRAPHVQVAPAATTQPEAPLRAEPLGLRPGAAPAAESRKPREGADVGGLPTAQVPWPEADSIENEIVRALRVTPSPPLAQNGAQRSTDADAPAAKKAAADHATTLGDLAERLEEALAREVRSAGQTRERLDLDLDAFAFEAEKPAEAAPPKKPAPERKADSVPAKPAAPQPERAKQPAASEPAPASVADPAAVAAAPAKPAPQPAKAASAEPAKAAAPVPEPAKAPAAPVPPPTAAKAAPPAPPPAAAKAAPPAPPPAAAKAAPPPAAAKAAPPSPAPGKAAAPAPEPAKIMAAAPEPEPRRESPAPSEHRQEEAPVISLSARRREPADPLEDEMARLLGELAGDTKR